MAIRAILYDNGRSADREPFDRTSTLRDEDNTPFDVRIEDISATGFRMRLPFSVVSDQAVTIGVPGVGVRGARIMWSKDGAAGCLFDEPLQANQINLALGFDTSPVLTSFPDGRADHERIATASDEIIAARASELSVPVKLALIGASAAGAWVLVIALFILVRNIVAAIL